jgi:hypothetical protein
LPVLFRGPVEAQTLQWRGFVDARAVVFPQRTINDPTRAVVEGIARAEASLRPVPWLRIEGGLDVRGDTHDQADRRWRLDWSDRGTRRPMLSARQITMLAHRGALSLEAGKQFIRWGKTDLVNPTDRFAPRDFLAVVDNDFLAITAARLTWARGGDSVAAIWQPRLTPSRLPLLDQRWTVLPAGAELLPVEDGGGRVPDRRQVGLRWNHLASAYEYSLSVFDGANHLPLVEGELVLFPSDLDDAQSRSRVLHLLASACRPLRAVRGAARAADR